MTKVLYLPTRYFPAISGAELYFQRMAEILSSKYDYEIDIYCSKAIDFKALRDPKGRLIKSNNKYFDKVNILKINRFPIDYEISLKEKINNVKCIEAYNSINLSDECLREILKNGPYLRELI